MVFPRVQFFKIIIIIRDNLIDESYAKRSNRAVTWDR
jgi:hypothetical protein